MQCSDTEQILAAERVTPRSDLVYGEAAKPWVGFVVSNVRSILGFPRVTGESSEAVGFVTKGLEMSCPQDDPLGQE